MIPKKLPKTFATEIVRILFDAGFTAYFAGGFVRDLLLGIDSDEIDIATNASPEKIISLFPKTIAVGKAFGVIIVMHRGHQFEVATFRKDHPYIDGRHPEGVDFSTPQKDAERRDFTINGMFFDPLTETLHDFVGGQEDLKKGVIRAIGDPMKRFQEDRLRMLRGVRFSARFSFPIERATYDAIKKNAHTLLPAVSMERIWQELNKMSQLKSFAEALQLLFELGLLQVIFPKMDETVLRGKIKFFPYFPLETPLIVYLLELFPKSSLEEKIALCEYLKVSNHDSKVAEFFHETENLFAEKKDNLSWARFYAHQESSLFLQVKGAKLEVDERQKFFSEHEERQKKLRVHIERIQQKKPLITSHHLEKEGVKSGKIMGELLKEGERLVVNENLSLEEALKRLKLNSLWPK